MKVVKSRAFKDRLKGHKQSVISLYSPYGDEGHMLYSVSRDGSARGWDLAKRQITIKHLLSRKNQTKEEREAEQQAFQNNNKEEKKEEQKIPPKDQIVSACFSEKSVFGSYQDGVIVEWNINTGQIIRQYLGHEKRISNMAILHDKKLLVTGSHDFTIRTWNIATGEPEALYKTSGIVNVMRVGDNNEIHAVVSRNIFYQINTANSSIIKCIKFNKHSITSFFFKDDILLFGNIQNKVLIYDLTNFDPEAAQKLEPKKILEGLGGWTLTMEFNNDHLYTGCDDRKIRVYKWPQIEEVQQLGGHDDGVISLSFADKMLYSGSFDHSIRSWDIREMMQRIVQRNCMSFEDVESKKYEVYYGVAFKNKKKKLPSKNKKKA